MVKMYNVHDQPIPPGLTQAQIEKAIKFGASVADWQIEEVTAGRMLATYRIRAHTVVVVINYSGDTYSIDYSKSMEMKVHCTEEDKENGIGSEITTGGDTCTGVDQPAYIHEKYREWVDNLNRAIRLALQG
jgi:hypothetical protein